MKERLQKILSHAGVASRRKAEEMILAGRIKVNGKIVRELGTEADIRKDRIEADGKPVRPERLRYFLFFKPDRVITSVSDPQGRRTVLDFFPKVKERIFPVGRLDYHTEGLLIMTNDGALDYRLAAKMEKGVQLDDGKTAPCEITVREYDEVRNRTYLTNERQVPPVIRERGREII